MEKVAVSQVPKAGVLRLRREFQSQNKGSQAHDFALDGFVLPTGRVGNEINSDLENPPNFCRTSP
jgi:hypothetical protein